MARKDRPVKLLASLLALACLIALATTAAGAKAGKGGDEKARATRMDRWRHRPTPGGFRAHIPRILAAGSAAQQRRAYRSVLRAALRDPAAPKLSADHSDGLEFSVTLPSGDLTGDGKDDAVELFETKLQGVRGTNGATLWSRPFLDWGGYVGSGRFDATAGDDLLIAEIHEEDLTTAWRWTIRLIALSGTTGNAIWTRTYENVWTIGGLGSTGLYTDLDFTIPFAMGETNGDSARDALIGRFNFAVVDSNLASEARAAAVFETVSGLNGQVIGSYPATGTGGGVPDAILAGTFTGDAPDDVVTSSVARSGSVSSLTIEGYPGRGGPAAWRSTVAMSGRSWMQAARLNGDTASDVLVGSRDSWVAIDGSTGSELWSDGAFARAWIRPAGDVNGDGGQDLIVIRDAALWGGGVGATVEAAKGRLQIPSLPGHSATEPHSGCYGYGYGYCEPPIPTPCDGGYGYGYVTLIADHYGYGYGGGGCSAVTISMVRGSDGEGLWDRFAFGWAEAAGDADGDGVGDVFVDGFELDEEAGEYSPASSILSGTDGEPVWIGPTSKVGFLTPFGADVDGDGGDDLLEIRFDESDSFRPIEGATGKPVWKELVEVDGWLWSLDSAKLDGQGRDTIETALDPYDWVTTSVARDGKDGGRMWHR